jgi:type II secretory pathway predicted ATPase ExeA
MYCDFYQLHERPFNVTSDPKFLYLNACYREALASLHYGISQRKGFITLIGEAGTGKTTLLKKLLDDLDDKTRTVFIFNTNVSFDEILEYIFTEFELPVHNGKRLYMLQRLNAFLLDELRNGRNVALLIDEAQDLEYSVLEDLRLLSNLETAKEKILQIVLSGQPELSQKLSNPGLRQLRQRVAINCRLMPLSRDEASEYIRSRLASAGSPDPKLFTRDAEERIYDISRGIPRLVNVICDNALVIGYALGKRRIGADVVSEAAADLFSLEVPRRGSEISEPSAAPAISSARESWVPSQFGVVTVVVVAILIGLLSVGRSLLRREAEAPVSHVSAPILEVIRPMEQALPAPMGDGQAAVSSDPRPASPASPAEMGPDAKRAAAIPPESNEAETALPRPSSSSDWPPGDAAAEKIEGTEPGRDVAPQADESLSRAEEPQHPRSQLAAVGQDPVTVGDNGFRDTSGGSSTQPLSSARTHEEQRVPLDPSVSASGSVNDQWAAAERGLDKIDPEEAERSFREVLQREWSWVAPQERKRREDVSLRVPVERHMRVRPGDSISNIAIREYGQATYTILDLLKIANPSIRDIDVISVGQTLKVPALDEGLALLQQPDNRYSLLLLSTPIQRRANQIEAGLRRHGFRGEITRTDFGMGRTIYRLVIPDLPDRETGISIGRELQRLFRDDAKLAAMAE